MYKNYTNNSQNHYSQAGAIHELPLQRVFFRQF